MTHAFRRVTNIFFALLIAVFSVNLSGIMTLSNAYADHNPNHNPPAGNNGTIKIGEFDADNGNANDPHVGCTLDVKFFGYDAGPRTATVTFEAQPPTDNQLVSPLGAQDVNFTGLGGNGNTLDHTETYTLAFTGAPQPNQGYHVKVTVEADGSQGSDTKHKTFWVEDCTPPTVTPTAPTFLEDCGSQNDKYVIPQTEGVIYQVKINNGGFQTVPADTYTISPAGAVVTVKALPADNTITLTGTLEWSHDFSTSKCNITATAPEKLEDCGLENDKYVIPNTPHVIYKVQVGLFDYDTKSAGPHGLNTFQKLFGVKIIAEAEAGYTLTGKKSWDLNFSAAPCGVPANPPVKIEACGTVNDKYTIPESEHIKYYVNLSPIAKPAGTYAAQGQLVGIIAVADPGYVVNTQAVWVFLYTDTACPTPATPGEVTSTDPCGIEQDGFTIPSTPGVVYKKGNDVLTAGFHAGTGTVTITAEAAPGYMLTAPASWTFDFTDEDCEPEPCVPTMVDAITLESILRDNITNDGNCEPGKGGGGGQPETPGTPSVVTPVTYTNVMLPQTGPDDNNALAKAFTLFIAGIATYGATFFLVNRRDVLKK